ncbi:GAF domain-containing SpoIIE family protein phosphatase [Oscillatoria sp. FACHB-1406]|uniref:PP2C family protein-serine/threonine phosphatase n=1 Tax=Oscillatoria sp. FACHB-1406 TaxID=2692846 RepID=UPI001689DB79|nr:GAF domain-containing SpoIIE family protein phosphatase [Oscillatoria sp. FACHB-1406]MBD2577526.1 SpoIIE family protein phosphatase [Oscillatoria sp. FACHB-1406]
MSAAPLPRQQPPSEPADESDTSFEATPVAALKDLVARLHREQNKVQNLLSSLGFALRSFNNLNQFLELVPLMAARVTDADGGALILFKANGQPSLSQIHCQEGYACQNIRTAIERAMQQSDRNAARVASSSPDSPALPVIKTPLDEQVKQFLDPEVKLFSTPIPVKSQERGRIYVFSSAPDYTWTVTRQRLVQLVADQTAVAISHHELTNELRQKERIDRELEIASEIQGHLLPNQCPEIEGASLAAAFKTANRIGGDYYDFIPTHPHPARRPSEENPLRTAAFIPWSIVIGDVMGKGVPAGLIMTMTRGMLRAEVLNRHSPARILQHLNQVMHPDLDTSHRFVTLFYSEYDPLTRVLSYSNAAHNPPLLWQAATGKLERLDTLGMLIGLEVDSEYEDAKIQLEPGDTILYYTDGLTDAANANGDRFDEENLALAFSLACQQGDKPQAILDALFNRIQQFVGSSNRHGDDMTAVVLQVELPDPQTQSALAPISLIP